LDLPEWLKKTAPQSWLPKMPVEDFDLKVFLAVTVLSAALLLIGWLGYLRRDMVEVS
ncbi:MAG TPA: tetronasin resistance protein, partial [Firmicutes bacterium]|nr:tetronasin resistance protein [Bacillota bacterium]